ncbi:bifunctional diaminohydroxyphosphoribosylaminopyrimidine deaminase/5-amino-6-(5-phosphoribosylamino)uracil reductase RibD [Idiomarina seosinensis]|uniref:bifunctional diaminohydroxyphosphoribosylaminopyrimidine deaminase/5-amino-6-(5-phosphoribosylamino)uracil reductase RibD n=1 Tax=Idiomarina seosinensis TaxID=281739 RepID=UPI00385070BB
MISAEQLTIDHRLMHQALILARRGVLTTAPNPAVGCVLARGEQVVGEGWHQRAGQAHAEVNAINAAGCAAQGATAYVTLEPCSHFGRTAPCVDALIDAGVARVVVAMQDPNPQVAGKGIKRLQQAGIKVDVGILQSAAQALNPGFIHRMINQLPYVRVKLACSMDGKTALANGNSQWITSPQARSDVQYWRAHADAILTGADTVLIDNPRLTVRAGQWPASRTLPDPLPQPVRIIIDSQNRIHDDLALFEQPGPVWLVRIKETEASRHPHCHQILVKESASGKVDLHDAMLELALREINLIWTECGATLGGALLRQQLVSQVFLYQSNLVLGNDAQAMIQLPILEELSEALQLDIIDGRQVGRDRRLIGVPKYNR